MAEVNWTDEAQRCLREIHDFIALEYPSRAPRVVEAILRHAAVLRRFPEFGYRYEKAAGENIRILVHGHYKIAYRVRPDTDIDILGVFHGALDIDRFLLP